MGTALVRPAGEALGLRWQLVLLNVVVIAVTVVLIIVLMHNIAQQEFMVIMHAAGQPVDPAAGQRAYDAAVEVADLSDPRGRRPRRRRPQLRRGDACAAAA